MDEGRATVKGIRGRALGNIAVAAGALPAQCLPPALREAVVRPAWARRRLGDGHVAEKVHRRNRGHDDVRNSCDNGSGGRSADGRRGPPASPDSSLRGACAVWLLVAESSAVEAVFMLDWKPQPPPAAAAVTKPTATTAAAANATSCFMAGVLPRFTCKRAYAGLAAKPRRSVFTIACGHPASVFARGASMPCADTGSAFDGQAPADRPRVGSDVCDDSGRSAPLRRPARFALFLAAGRLRGLAAGGRIVHRRSRLRA